MGKMGLLLSAAFFMGILATAMGATWYVDGSVFETGDGTSWETAFQTIQEGIDAAAYGDTVSVAEGTYVENIHFRGKNITLTSTDPFDPTVVAKTIIDGGQSGSVVTFAGTEDETCLLSGFTIRNGAGKHGGGICGGEWDQEHSRARIERNSITGNHAVQHGGGVALCRGVVRNNAISGNSAGAGGGGLAYCDDRVQNNVIAGNSATSGGGLHCCDGTIQNNTISGNSAKGYHSSGGGLYNCDGMIANNVISDNSSRWGGGLGYCGGTIRNSIIARNSAELVGGGLRGCSGKIENNTIAGNFAAVQGGGLYECKGTLLNCIIWGNTAGYDAQLAECSYPTFCCIEGLKEGSAVNLPYYPYFADPEAGDYHLETWSPCIDAGDPASEFSSEPQPNGGRVNMGAYGNAAEAASAWEDSDGDSLPDEWEMHFFGDLEQEASDDLDADGVSNLQEYRRGTNPTEVGVWYVDRSVTASGDGRTWETALKTIQEGLEAASDWETVVVAEGTYVENITFNGKNIVLTSTDPNHPEVVARTIIDGGGKGSVVRFSGCEDETCVLSGFTIRNGIGTTNIEPWVENFYGGGVFGGGGRQRPGTLAAICNNTIVGNSADYGGGLCGCDGTIQGNTIKSNRASAGGGGLIWCNGTIRNNSITGNQGSGLRECEGIIPNNSIYGNSYYAPGGGLADCGGTIRNCIIWGNSSSDGTQIDWGHRSVYRPERFTYCCVQDWARGGDGNVNLYPHFTDPQGGDFHLRSWSPCTDAGDPASPFSKEPEPNGGFVNMGAYGNTPEAASKSPDTDADGLPDDWEMHWFGDLGGNGTADPDGDGSTNIMEYRYGWNPVVASPNLVENVTKGASYQTIQAALADGDEGDEIVVYAGVYKENIKFSGKNVVLRSTDPLDPSVTADTIIDGGGKWSVVTFSGTENQTCVLSGFTILNGNGTMHPIRANLAGGGIYGGENPTGATIENNMITGNSTGYGGGIFGCNGAIRNNVITGNSAKGMLTTNGGGGLAYCDGTIEGNMVTGNSVRERPGHDASGGGLYKCNGWIKNNTITGNTAQTYGAGLSFCNGTIENNTISENSGLHGSGLYYCDATIRNNVISNNAASQAGGGLKCCNGTIENNTISGNWAKPGDGGGLCCCSGTIKNNLISGNSVSCSGGGLRACDGMIQNNIITGNSAGRCGGGLYQCNGTVERNIISGNSAQDAGGGLYQCDGTIKNCLVTANSAPHGGALHSCNGTIQNSTIAGNSAEAGPNGGALNQCEATIVNCIIWGNPAGPQLLYSPQPFYSCIEGFAGGVGNLRCNPYFVDAANDDYHLQSWSPCIDAGDPTSPFSEEPEPSGWRINMGAYGDTPEATSKSSDSDNDGLPDDWETEFFGNLAEDATGDADGDLIPNIQEYQRGLDPTVPAAIWHVDASVEMSGDGTSWATAFKTIQGGIEVASEGDSVIVAEGTYLENIQFRGEDISLTSRDPLEPTVVASTIIDGSQSGSAVTFSGAEGVACSLSGFTIRNGHSDTGGGICGGGTGATIRYNAITENSAQQGGGLHGCDGVIQFNRVARNEAEWYGGGLADCDAMILNNTILGNSADFGGGLHNCRGMIENNTIYGNSADEGGALCWCDGVIRNCIIWGNTAPRSPQLRMSSVPTYCCIQSWMGGGEGNIAYYPHFIDPVSGDFRLRTWSPCIDSGDPSSSFSNEPEPNGGRVNMGAYGNASDAASKSADTDADDLPDDWEFHRFNSLEEDGSSDPDGDRILNSTEHRYGWNPTVPAESLVENATKNLRYEAIQPALMESADGDEIVAYPGVYEENIFFGGKNVVLRSGNPTDVDVVANTRIDGTQSGPVIAFSGTEDESCILAGFTIRNGRSYAGAGICGGTLDNYTHATIEYNNVTGNFDQHSCAAVWGCDGTIQNNSISANEGAGLEDCHGSIQNNIISGNSRVGLSGCDATMRNNTISGNDGAGFQSCNGIIEDNIICGNKGYYGGGMDGCNATIRNNIIAGNSAEWGGGLYSCGDIILNNTIVNNSARVGGGLYECGGTIVNCIIWANTAPESAQLHYSSAPTHCCIQGWTGDGEGNIAQDPRFVDAENGNFRLSPSSPCIDAGENLFLGFFVTDIAGMHRIMYGGKSFTVDMGAYEYYVNNVELGLGPDETTLTWSSLPYRTYSIFYSDDLLTWHQARDVPSAIVETTSWIDDGSLTGSPPSLVPWRFYRVREKP